MKNYIEISFNYNEEADKNIAKRKKCISSKGGKAGRVIPTLPA